MQDLRGFVKERLNEDLSLSQRAGSLRFSIDLEKDLEMTDKETFLPEPGSTMIDGLKKRKKHVQSKTKKIGIYGGDHGGNGEDLFGANKSKGPEKQPSKVRGSGSQEEVFPRQLPRNKCQGQSVDESIYKF